MALGRSVFKLMDKVVIVAYWMATSALAVLFTRAVIRIFLRFFLSLPMHWIPGVITLFGNWAVFLGVGVYLYRNEDIVIDYFYEKFLPLKGRKYVDFFVSVLLIIFTLVMICFSWDVILSGNHQSSLSTLKIKHFWYSLPILLGMALGLLGVLKRLLVSE